jgi:hypothetical protein
MRKGIMGCVALLGAAVLLSGCAGVPKPGATPPPESAVKVTMTRADLVEALAPRFHVGLRLHLRLSEEEQAAVVDRMRAMLPDAVEEFLPETLQARSPAVVEAILPHHIVVDETDPRFNRLLIEKTLREVKMGFELAKRIEPMTPERARALERNVDMLGEGLRDAILPKLDWVVDAEELKSYLAERKEIAVQDIDNPVRLWYKTPVGEDRVRELVAEAAAKIDERVPEYKARLGRAMAKEDPEKRAEALHVVGRSVLIELCIKPYEALGEATVQPDLAGLQPADLDPSYPYVVEKWRTRGEELSEDRIRDTSEGR